MRFIHKMEPTVASSRVTVLVKLKCKGPVAVAYLPVTDISKETKGAQVTPPAVDKHAGRVRGQELINT